MTGTPNPITPPAGLVQGVAMEALSAFPDDEGGADEVVKARNEYFANYFAQWGADQELEACCEWVGQWCGRWPDGTRPEGELRAARRPRPPSEKEQTLLDLDWIQDNQSTTAYDDRFDRIRRALEQLND